MSVRFQLIILAGILGGTVQAEEQRWAVPSWGDVVCLYGPGTDASMDSPEALERTIRRWQARGMTGVTMRTDLADYEPMISRNASTQQNPRLQLLLDYVDVVHARYNVLQAVEQIGRPLGFQAWAWHPNIYSDGGPAHVGTPGLGRMIPWSYVSKYLLEEPEGITRDRQGNPLWMVREYAYPKARATKISEFVHMARQLGIKRFLSCMRSEVNQLVDPPLKADQYGFNPLVVQEMQEKYGVNILTDPRFDVFAAGFRLDDPMVENWRRLRGEHITQFYRELRAALDEVDPEIEVAVTLSGDYAGPPLGNQVLDWRTWVDEGLIDAIVAPVFFEGTVDPDAGEKGYLTHVRAGIGVVPYETIKAYIEQSAHPEVRVIATGGWPYFDAAPPPGTDGWRVDVWYELYTSAWYQRWSQWMRDLRELGEIRFLEQNFDTFPNDPKKLPPAGSAGLVAYDPELRACPGGWYPFGDQASGRPLIQSQVIRGTSGNAVRLTSNGAGGPTLTGYHASDADRSNISAVLDTSISSGRCRYQVWVYRESVKSGLITYLEDRGGEMDVGMRVAPQTGTVSYTTGRVVSEPNWVATPVAIPVGKWTALIMDVNLVDRTYAVRVGDPEGEPLAQGIALTPPPPRTTMQNGVNVEIPVPSYKAYKQVLFQPLGVSGASTVIDDVSVDWVPDLEFEDDATEVFFADDFEANENGTDLDGKAAQDGAWTTSLSEAGAFAVISGTSYREGTQALLANRRGTLQPVPARSVKAGADSIVTFDLDAFVRSSGSFPIIIPGQNLNSGNSLKLSIATTDGAAVATAEAINGEWKLSAGGGGGVVSEVRVPYDCWFHVQLAVDFGKRTCTLVQQQIGQVAQPLATVPLPAGVGAGGDLAFRIGLAGPDPANNSAVIDNVRVAGKSVETRARARNWGPSGAGGSGIWDTATANWYNGSSATLWDAGAAVFQGTAGTVTVIGTRSAAGLTFNSNFYTIEGGTIALTGGAISGTGTGTTISSALSGSSGLLFSGGGSRTIDGNNTGLTGLIDVAAGVVRVGNNNALGSSSANKDRVQLQGGTVLQLNGGIAFPKAITTTGVGTIQAIGNSSISGAVSFGSTTVFQLDGGAGLTLRGSAGLGSTGSTLVTDGTGRLILDTAGAGATAYGFLIRGTDVTVQANAVANPFGVGANISLGDSAGAHTLALNGATIGNNAFLYATASSRKIENMAAGTSAYAGQVFLGDFTTVLRSTTTSGTLAVSGHLRDDGGTANLAIGNATHQNAGTVLFSRAEGNLYDGSTTVHSGLLAVSNTSGSSTGSGAVTVGSGGTLGGTGIIGGPVSVSGSVAPGIGGIGTLRVNNDVKWSGGRSWAFELGRAPASDHLRISGDFRKSGGSVFRFDFRGTGQRGTYILAKWDGTTDFSASDFSYTNLAANLDGEFRINGNQLEFTTPTPAIAITRNGSNLELIWSNGSLQSTADLVNGPWLPVSGATSPWVFTPSEPKRFYRAVAP